MKYLCNGKGPQRASWREVALIFWLLLEVVMGAHAQTVDQNPWRARPGDLKHMPSVPTNVRSV